MIPKQPKPWKDLLEDFRRVVAEKGFERVAGELPAGRATVYRLFKGETRNPPLATRASVQRMVQEDQAIADGEDGAD